MARRVTGDTSGEQTGRGPPAKGYSESDPSAYCCGAYQLARPSCSSLPSSSGVLVPLMAAADAPQVSFSRLGVPRDRIWVGGADGGFTLAAPADEFLSQRIGHFRPGSWTAGRSPAGALPKISANSGEATQVRKVFAASGFRRLGVHADADVGMVRNVAGVAPLS